MEAARNMIVLLTEMTIKLRELGYRTIDEFPIPRRLDKRIVPITQEWIDEWNKNTTELDRLKQKLKETGDKEDYCAYVHALCTLFPRTIPEEE